MECHPFAIKTVLEKHAICLINITITKCFTYSAKYNIEAICFKKRTGKGKEFCLCIDDFIFIGFKSKLHILFNKMKT